LLKARPVHLDFLDAQYGPPACMQDIAKAIYEEVRASGAPTLLLPMGLFHSDHELTHAAGLLVMRRYAGVAWAYEEPSYRDVDAALDRRLAQLQQQGIMACRMEKAGLSCGSAKRAAVDEYASQTRGLRTTSERGYDAILEPERYWRLACGTEPRVTAVVLTHNRCDELLTTLRHLQEVPERPATIVVDNASTDGTYDAVRHEFPNVHYIRSEANAGAASRNLGIEMAKTPYVALCDDDTWWEDGSLGTAADLLDAHARLAIVNARVLVGPSNREDPMCTEISASPLPRSPCLPGPALLGFMAGAVVLRRDVFLEAGGFDPHFFIGGEEQLLALDVTSQGWELAYIDSLAVHHHPSVNRESSMRRQTVVMRNELWVTLLRRPLRVVLRQVARSLRLAIKRPEARSALIEAAKGLPWTLVERKTLPQRLERNLRLLERET